MIPPPRPYLLKLLLFLAAINLGHSSYGQVTEVRGHVIDAGNKQPLSYATIQFKGNILSVVQTDADGFFILRSYTTSDSIVVHYIGYTDRVIRIKRGAYQDVNIMLTNKGIELKAIVVKPTKRRRHQVDTPALYVFRQVVAHKKDNREESLNDYKAEEYQKMIIGVVNPKMWFLKLKILKPFAFALANRDTTADSTVTIPALLKEDVTDVYYRKDPRTIRRITKATQFTGIKNKSLGNLLNYTFDRINIYDEIFVLLDKSFVSPFAEGAYATTYDYFLRDTMKIDGRTSYKLSFVGKSNIDVALKGYAWIDSATWGIKSIEFRPNEHANLNYLKDYNISQSYKLFNNKTWMLTSEDLMTQATIIKRAGKNQMGVVVKKHLSLRDIQIDVPIPDSIFAGSEKEIILPGAHDRTKEYWDTMRFDPLKLSEIRLIKIHDTIKSVPAYKRFYWVIKVFTTGKLQCGPIDFGRITKFVSENSIEGVRLRLGAETNEFFSNKYHIFGYLAYGTRDKVFRYNITTHFPLPEKNDLWRQFEFYYQYDLNQLGAQSQLLTFDNFLTLLGAAQLTKIMSIREWKLSLENEWIHGFTSIMSAHQQIYYDIPGVFDFKVRQDDGNIAHIPNFNTFELGIDNRYSYHDKYYRAGFYRFFITTKSPVFLFNYHIGVLDLDGKTSVYNKFIATMVHRLAWTLGHTWYQIQAGKILGKSPYPISFVTAGGQSIYFNGQDYNMLSQFEFVTDQYVAVYLEHHFDGYFLNKIPYVNRLQLREIIYMRSLWGSYSQSNYNTLLPGFDFKAPSAYPYVEAGIGVENIFKVLRFDSVWRLDYLFPKHSPNGKNWWPKIGINVIF
jgi:hypothetical protein